MTSRENCPFCEAAAGKVCLSNDHAKALWDEFPCSQGHTLVVPFKHVASIFELSDQEHAAIWALVAQVRALLATTYHPDGFTIGINDGEAAGQTIAHAHVHVIPRNLGDVPDPRGGLRWVIPQKANYWERMGTAG